MARKRKNDDELRRIIPMSLENRAYAGEMKYFGTDFTHQAIPIGGVIVSSLNLVAQGVEEDERIGRNITIRSLQMRGRAQLASGALSDHLRVIVYLDTQCNGASAAVLDILETAVIDSFRNPHNFGRFRFLTDSTITFNPSTLEAPLAVTTERYTKFNASMESLISFSGILGAQGEIRGNNLGVLMISDVGILNMRWKARIRFRG